MADPDLLSRAVSNLLRNAVQQAASEGPIWVRSVRDGDQACIVVADEGPDVPEGDLQAMFTPFHRPEASRDRRTGGAGLGLAIVRTAIEACGGSVACRNLMLHKDPFDRILIAQAVAEGLDFVTNDEHVSAYLARTIW